MEPAGHNTCKASGKGSALAMETEGVDLWICISLVPRRSRFGQSWTLL